MRIAIPLLLLLPACAVVQPVRLSEIDVHANPCVFSGAMLPKIQVVRPGSSGPSERFTVTTRFYDSAYNLVASAQRPGRYGAIVELTSKSGQTLRRFLTLYRTSGWLDWDGARMPVTVQFPAPMGVDPRAAGEQHEAISEFFKTMLQQSSERTSDVAVLLAGLQEAGAGSKSGEPFVARHGFIALDQQWWFGLKQKTGTLGLPYLVHLPVGYEKRCQAPFSGSPLILLLHGSGEAGDGGDELGKVQGTGLAKMLKTAQGLPEHFPFIVVMPQCPRDQWWSPYELNALLDEIEAKYRVDPDRIYLTGLSLGGYGVWDTAMAFPHRFAAIAPVCGAGDAADVQRIKDLPVWVFHGEKDATVPVSEAHRMVDALNKVGGRVRLTIYLGIGHDSWNKAYATPELYEWFLQQRRGAPTE